MDYYDYVEALMKKNLDNFIKTLPDFLNDAKNKYPTTSAGTIVFKGIIDHVIMREWCKIADKYFLPFKLGMTYNYSNNMYETWEKRDGFIYVTAKYFSYKCTDPLELSWSYAEEIKDGEWHEIQSNQQSNRL